MRSALDFAGFSWRDLQRQRRRVLPGLLGVSAGVAILLSVVAGTDWIATVTNSDILSQRSLSQITVTPGSALTFTNADVQWMQSLKGVQGGYPLVTGAFPAAIGSDGTIFQLGNLPSEADRPALVAGVWPGNNQVAVPDSGMMSKSTGQPIEGRTLLDKSVTLLIPISNGLGAPKSSIVRVVGVYRWNADQGIERTVYIPLATLESILGLQGTWTGSSDASGSAGFGTYVLDADAPRDVAGIATQLEAHGFRTQYVEQSVHGLSSRIESIQAAAGVLVLLIAFFAALSISNTLVQAVRQRRREIAVLLAVGFSPAWVGASVVLEMVFVGLASIVLGLIAAEVGVTVLGATQPGLDLHVGPASVLIVGAGAIAFSLGAAWLPTRHAMRVDPVEVLREE